MEKIKKKKGILFKILFGFGLFLLLTLLGILIIPIIYKNEIKELVLKEANQMLKAEVKLADFDLTFLSSFPELSIELNELTIDGKENFNGVRLAQIETLEAKLNFWSVIGGEKIEIEKIGLVKPVFDIRILKDGSANYDIVISEDELSDSTNTTDSESSFKLSLKEYWISNAELNYSDDMYNMYAQMNNLSHSGKGDLTLSSIDFLTNTTIDKFSFEMDNIAYLTEVKSNLDMNILMEFTENSEKFTLKENELKLNEVKLSFDGYYEMLAGYDEMDLSFNAEKTSFKDLLSLIPTFYRTGYESMVTNGSFELDGSLKGKLDDNTYPAFNISSNVAKASIKYPDLKSSINNIDIQTVMDFPGGSNLDLLKFDLAKFHADFMSNSLDASLAVRNLVTDPYIKSSIQSNLLLSEINEVIPMEEPLSGKLISDVELEGKISDLEKERYEQFSASGNLKLTDFSYPIEGFESPLMVSSILFMFEPEQLKLEEFDGKIGHSDMMMFGTISNYLAYFFRDEALKGDFTFKSSKLDIDQLMSSNTGENEVESETVADSTQVEPIIIPKNIDFTLRTEINEVFYEGNSLQNLKGKVTMSQGILKLDELNFNGLGGNILLNGLYDSNDEDKPHFEFGYDLKNLDIQQLSKSFITVQKIAPILSYSSGRLSSKFSINGDMDSQFNPLYDALTGNGDFLSNELQLSGFQPLDKLSEVLDIESIKKGTLKNIKSSFEFKDGKVILKKPIDCNFDGIKAQIVEGYTTFDQEINYKLQVDVPKNKIPPSILQSAEMAVSSLKNIPGFKMTELPDFIPVNALVVNTITSPEIKTDFKEQLMSLGGGVKDAIKDLVEEKIEEIKDSVKEVLNDKVEDINEELQLRKQKLLDDAQKQADQIVAEAKKIADKTRLEGDKNAQKLIDEAGNNPLKRSTAELAAKKIRKEANESADKIELEAQKRAEAVMNDAKEKAAKLE